MASRSKRWVVPAAAILLLVPVAVLCTAGWLAVKRGELRDRTDWLLAELTARSMQRPVLRGEPRSGRAWDHYRRALRLGREGAGAQAATAALQRGAACADASLDIAWEDGFDAETPDVVACLGLGKLVAGHAHVHVVNRQARAATGVLVDCAVFGRDVASTGTLISYLTGCAIVDEALSVLSQPDVMRALSAEHCAELARQLETLDGCMPPPSLPYHVEAVAAGVSLLSGRAVPVRRRSGVGGWLHGVGVELLVPDALETLHSSMASAARSTGEPWSEARDRVEQLREERSESINPLARQLLVPSSRHLMEPRLVVARLRLLRILLRYRANADVLRLDDPFGGVLRVEATEDRVRAWSIGPDGAGEPAMQIDF